MKANYMEEFALPTIEKVQDMTKKAEAVKLHLCVKVDLAQNCSHIAIYNLDENGMIKTPSVFWEAISCIDKLNHAREFQQALEEAELIITEYPNQEAALLEKEIDDLNQRLADAKDKLGRVKK